MLAIELRTRNNKKFMSGMFDTDTYTSENEFIIKDNITNFESIDVFFNKPYSECISNFFGVDNAANQEIIIVDPSNSSKYLISPTIEHYKHYLINKAKSIANAETLRIFPEWKQTNAINDKTINMDNLISLIGGTSQEHYNKIYAFIPSAPYTKTKLYDYTKYEYVVNLTKTALLSGIMQNKLNEANVYYSKIISGLCVGLIIENLRTYITNIENDIEQCTQIAELPEINQSTFNDVIV